MRALRLLLALTTLATLWSLAQQPFVAPYVERTAAEIRVAVEAELAREVDAEWLAPRLTEAIAARDSDRVELLTGIAAQHGLPLTEAQEAEVAAFVTQHRAEMPAICLRCAVEPESCPGLGEILACNLPFELTPFGDLNALRRGAQDWAAGDEVDQLDVGLAAAGLTATGAGLVTAGSSLSVKAASGVVRVAKRTGRLTPGLRAVVTDGAKALRPGADAAGLVRLRRTMGDLGAIRANATTTGLFRMLPLIDGPADAARFARVSEAMGGRTSEAVVVLGKSRLFRATVRLTDRAATALLLLIGLGAQIGLFLMQMMLRALLRGRGRSGKVGRFAKQGGA
ncbi:hypothetical protein [Pontivivens ytuae]|uniref:Uncharacterized protein n=1 Tax=Pontivivens ytuae TaxID=2789856 RepID=A0A7S9QBR9_9RHOB|nr:hypothetical protein [Pontivivens ytuae]QPH52627.1 hypothetical protein I0K15_12475 [Pontivivens ytuae]